MNWVKKIITNRDNRKKRLIKSKRLNTKIVFLMDMVEIAFPVALALFCLGIIVYLLFQLKVEGMETILDFIIASMAGLFLVFSLVNKNLSDRWKYIVSGTIVTCLCSIGFVIVMIISLHQMDGSVARVISLVSLIISGLDELIDYIKFQIGYVTTRKNEKELEINDLESEGIFNNMFDSKN